MFDFNPRSPYSRRMWHYESDRPLSIAQLIARRSLDARTAALLWLLIERHTPFLVSGPTDPTPGVGKTTTLNALLGFLPAGSTLVYTLGMFEDFGFQEEVDPATTCVLANEVSNHLRIYMWGRVARTLLRLPQAGYAIASSCHADRMSDVIAMLRHDLHLDAEDIAHLGVIVNIGLTGTVWPPQRRFLTVNYLLPEQIAETTRADLMVEVEGCRMLPLAHWEEHDDSFASATPEALEVLAGLLELSREELEQTLAARAALLERLAEGHGVGVSAMRDAIDAFALEAAGDAPELTESDDANS